MKGERRRYNRGQREGVEFQRNSPHGCVLAGASSFCSTPQSLLVFPGTCDVFANKMRVVGCVLSRPCPLFAESGDDRRSQFYVRNISLLQETQELLDWSHGLQPYQPFETRCELLLVCCCWCADGACVLLVPLLLPLPPLQLLSSGRSSHYDQAQRNCSQARSRDGRHGGRIASPAVGNCRKRRHPFFGRDGVLARGGKLHPPRIRSVEVGPKPALSKL